MGWQAHAGAACLEAILAKQGNGTTEAPGTDGIPRLFSFAPFGGAAQSADAYVALASRRLSPLPAPTRFSPEILRGWGS